MSLAGPEHLYIFNVPDKGNNVSGVMLESIYSQGEEVVREGRFIDDLKSTYLAGYLEGKEARLRKIPTVVEEVLIDSLFSHPDIIRVELMGSVARTIAQRHLPDCFWQYGAYFEATTQELVESGESEAGKMTRTLSQSGAAEVDLKISGNQEIIPGVFEHYAKKHGISKHDIGRSEIVHDDFGKEHIARKFRFSNPSDPHFTIEVYMGPIPTNLQRRTMGISIIDTRTDRPVFRIDVVELVVSGEASLVDRRQVKTTTKQDECRIALYAKKNHVFFRLPKSAVDVLKEQDRINAETSKPGNIAELFFRTLRINLLHEINEVTLNDGSKIGLPDLTMFFPQVSSDSLFSVRAQVFQAVQDGERIPKNILPLVQKEFALCLTIDPFTTIQALRDSGISLLIPGLRKMKRWQWEKILKSQHLVVSPSRAREEERSMDFIERERKLYRRGDPGRRIPKPFRGLVYFVRALQENDILPRRGNEWALYMSLWEKVRNQETGSLQDKERRIRRSSVLSSISLLGQRFTLIKNGIELRPEDVFRLEKVWDALYQYTDGTSLEELFDRYSELEILHQRGLVLSSEEQKEMRTIWNYIQNIAILYSILDQFPIGITPRELQRLYEKAEIDITKITDFRSLFYTLKTLGVVKRHDQKRVNVHRVLENASFYTLRTHASVYMLDDFVTSSGFLNFLATQFNKDDVQQEIQHILIGAQAAMQMAGIPTIEALQSLGKKDFSSIQEIILNIVDKPAIAEAFVGFIDKFRSTSAVYIQEHGLTMS